MSLREAIDIFADLVGSAADAAVLIEHEIATKPTTQRQPLLSRPFDDAAIYDPIAVAIRWPFDHPAASRYSAGAYGVWYGGRTLKTTVYETVHHFRRNTLASDIARSSIFPIVQERRVHLVHCSAALVDLRALCGDDPRLMDSTDYAHCQALGAELHASFLPGVITMSARQSGGEVVGVFVKEALSNPRNVCYLTYVLEALSGRVTVERTPGETQWIVDP